MLNGAHVHLLVNHIPVLAAGFALVFFILALWRNSDGWLRGGLLLLVFALAGDLAAYLSGPSAVHAIAGMPRSSDAALEAHHARAGYAIVTGVIVVVVGAIALILRKRNPQRSSWAKIALAAATLVHALVLAWTSLAGGKINHPELQDAADQRSGAVAGDPHQGS